MQGDFEAFYLWHVRAIYRVCYAFMKNAQEENGSVLAAVLALPSGSWRAYWASGGVRYYVTNTDGADSAAVTTVTAALIAQNDAD